MKQYCFICLFLFGYYAGLYAQQKRNYDFFQKGERASNIDVFPQSFICDSSINMSFISKIPSSINVVLKSNLLYNALLIPNLGIEFYSRNNICISFTWRYAWWKNNHSHYFWRTYGGELEVRKWFGRKLTERLIGHYVGVYTGTFTYDFELGKRGYLSDRWNFHYGFSYGYSLPIASFFNLDCSIGVGCLTGRYKEYLPKDDCYVWKATKNRFWVGPTKAEVSLVWLFMHGLRQRKAKGGFQ